MNEWLVWLVWTLAFLGMILSYYWFGRWIISHVIRLSKKQDDAQSRQESSLKILMGNAKTREESPLDILKRRYAAGEIDRDTFQQMRDDVNGSTKAAKTL